MNVHETSLSVSVSVIG